MNLPKLKTRQFVCIYLCIILVPIVITTVIAEKEFNNNPPIGAYIPPWFGSIVSIIYALGLGSIIHLVLFALRVKDYWYIFFGYLTPALIMVGLSIADIVN